MADLYLAQVKTLGEDIAVACKHLRGYEGWKRLTYDAIVRFVGIAHGASIASQFHKRFSSTGQMGRPPLLPEEAQSLMIEHVHTRRTEHDPGTYAELLDSVEHWHGIILSDESLRHIVRSMTTVNSVIGIPKDSERLDVDASEIDAS
jgi:hypothetical protein